MATKRQVIESCEPRTVDVAGFCVRLGISPTTFQRWKREQRLPPVLPSSGKAQLWDAATVDTFAAECGREGGVPPVRDQLAGSCKPAGVPRFEARVGRERHAQALLLKLAAWGCGGGAYLADGVPTVWCAVLCSSTRAADLQRQRARLEQILQNVGPGLDWRPVDMPASVDGPQS